MANGERLRIFGVAGPGLSPGAVSYNGHIPQLLQKQQAKLTDRHSLVIFHYVTRSRADFVARKIKMRSGVYATSLQRWLRREWTRAWCFTSTPSLTPLSLTMGLMGGTRSASKVPASQLLSRRARARQHPCDTAVHWVW